MPLVSVIVVTFNSAKHIAGCLHFLEKLESSDRVEVILIDNASQDGTIFCLPEVGRFLRVLNNDENVGFARAVNRAANFVCGKYLLLLNPDAVISMPMIRELVQFAESKPEFGIYGPRALFPDARENPKGCWNAPTLWSVFCLETGLTRAFRHSGVFDPEYVRINLTRDWQSVDILSGYCTLIRRDLWDELKGFDESFYMYGEDADFCLRAAKLGWKPVVVPRLVAKHAVAASAASAGRMQSQVNAGRLGVVGRHLPSWQKFPIQCLMRFGAALRLSAAKAVVVLKGAAGARAVADAREVWNTRSEWLAGYHIRR